MAVENSFSIKGTLFAKDTRRVPNKKKPTEPDYEFNSIRLEISTRTGERVWTEIPEFNLGKGVSFEEYSVGDFIEVWFSLAGKKVSDTWWKTSLQANMIRFADLDTDGRRPTSAKPKKEVETVFVPPTPILAGQEEDFTDLPF